VTRVALEVKAREIEALLAEDPQAAVEALKTLLGSADLRSLVNPELLETLTSSPDPAFHARDIAAALRRGLAFEATDPSIFVRPGVVDFAAFVDKIGRVGSFYAGYGPADRAAMDALVASCAPRARGLAWEQVAALPFESSTCGARLRQLVLAYRTALKGGTYPSRLDDTIGAHLPAVVTTAVLQGEAVDTWRAARAAYRQAQPITGWNVRFDDVKVGYWAGAADLARVMANPRGFTDLKTQRRVSLGTTTWRTALRYSPAEPGLARGLELPDGRVSVGGWSDLQPVLVLENLGCRRTIFLTRQGGAGSFESGVARLLGLTDADAAALWQLDDAGSSFAQALANAEGVWCTDWDGPAAQDLAAMSKVGYDAPFESTDPRFVDADDPYANLVSRTGIAGCTLGVP
jgi:hypothetical protein